METAMEGRNKAIVQRWIDEVFNSRRLSSVDELKVSSYLDWTPLPAPYQHVDLPVSGIKEALPEWLSGLPDFHFASDRLAAEGDFVVCLGHWQAHQAGHYKGLAPTGKRVGGTRIDIFRVAGDRMVEHWGCGNELAFLQLIGALESRGDADVLRTDEDVARAFVERVFGGRDVAAVVDLLDPHAIDHSRQGLSLLALIRAFPDLRVEVQDVASNGDIVDVTSRITGTHEHDYLGAAPTGKIVRAERIDRFRFAGHKIAETWRLSDDRALAQRLGACLEPVSDGSDPVDAKDVAASFVNRVLNAKDIGAAAALVDPAALDHLTGSLTTYLTFGAFPDFQLSTEHIIGENDVVSVLATFTGTQEAPILGIPPTGTGVTGRVAFSFRVADGCIAETWAEIEPWTLLQQLRAPALT
jgi:predicted ester cyclase